MPPGELWLNLQRATSGLLAHGLSLSWKAAVQRRVGGTDKARCGVFADTVTMATEPQSFKSVHQVLPRWGWFLQAATRNTSSESQGQLLLHRNQDYYPPLPPFLSWRPPSATVAGCLSARSSGQQGALAGRLQSTFFKGKREVSRWPKQSGLSVAILKQFL